MKLPPLNDATAGTERIRHAIQHRIAQLIPDGHTVQIIKHASVEPVEANICTE